MRTLIPPPDVANISDAELEAYNHVRTMFDHSGPGTGSDSYPAMDVFGALLNSPTFASRLIGVGTALALPTASEPLPGDTREWADMSVAIVCHRTRRDPSEGCALRLLYNHMPAAVAAGVRLEGIEALWRERPDDLTADERLYFTFVRDVLAGSMSDETFGAVEERLGRRWAVEYAAFALLVQYVLRLEEAVGCRNATPEEVERRIEELRAEKSQSRLPATST